MIGIVIEDDGKVSLKTTNGISETEIAATIVVEAMRNLFPQKASKDIEHTQTTYYLYLCKVEDSSKLSTVKTLSKQPNIPSERAKIIIDSTNYENVLLTQSSDKSFIDNIKKDLESVGCICEIIKN